MRVQLWYIVRLTQVLQIIADMKFAPLSFLSLLSGLFILPLNARDYYILFDGNCMDKLSYVYESGSYSDTALVVHINLGQGEKVILETGRSAPQSLSYVPANFISCGNGQFNETWVNALRKGSDRYFLIMKQDVRNYGVYPVVQASFFRLRDWVMAFSGQYYQFEFNLLEGTIGENIAAVNQQAEVYFEGRIENDCSGGFIFRQFSKTPGIPQHIDILLSPEIGILEERSGKNAEDAFNRVKRLVAINDKSPDTYLKILCGVLPKEPVAITSTAPTNMPVPDAGFTAKGVTSAQQLVHTIAKGETLFAIARRYKIGMEDLIKWNKIEDTSLIFPGDKLSLVPPDPTPADGPAPYDMPGLRPMTKPDIIEDDVIVFGAPTPQSGNFVNKGVAESPALHTVVAGETVASIAYKYGYAEWKFREFNNLSKDAFVRIGQQLKTSHCATAVPEQAQPYVTSYDDATTPRFDWQAKVADPYATKVATPINRNTATFYDTTPKGGAPTPYDSRPVGSRKFHIVLEGETLFGIARKYQLSIEDLRAINQLEKNEIVVPAQKIYLEP